jgi:RimJ/RimL family protein N-acetyltransferase
MEIDLLHRPMADGDIALEPLAHAHREGLRACCRVDDPIWPIYPVNLVGEGFDGGFAAVLGDAGRRAFAVLQAREVVGMTAFLNLAPERQTLELGGTFMAPWVRGTGLNTRVKRLMLARAFGAGVRRVEFRVDARNGRSLRAVEKLGAVREGVLRAERITWTGHLRDTVMFSILSGERQG